MEEVADAPSRWHYAVRIALLIAGFILFPIFLFKQATHTADSLPKIQVVVPGTHESYLVKPGRWSI